MTDNLEDIATGVDRLGNDNTVTGRSDPPNRDNIERPIDDLPEAGPDVLPGDSGRWRGTGNPDYVSDEDVSLTDTPVDDGQV